MQNRATWQDSLKLMAGLQKRANLFFFILSVVLCVLVAVFCAVFYASGGFSPILHKGLWWQCITLSLAGFILLCLTWRAVVGLVAKAGRCAQDMADENFLMESILTSLNDVLIIMDNKGIIQSAKGRTVSLVGYSEEGLKGRCLNSIFDVDEAQGKDFPDFLSGLLFNCRGRRSYCGAGTVEALCMHGDGRIVPVLCTVAEFPDRDGRTGGIVCAARDISDRKASEKEIQERQFAAVHAGHLTALSEMASGIAHEINQPLAIIRLAADGLKAYFEKGDAPAMESAVVQKIITQVDRAAAIIARMRTFARSGSSTVETLNLCEPVEMALSFFTEQFHHRRINLVFTVGEGLPGVRVDPKKFEQIVVNLLSNARYAVDKKAQMREEDFQKTVEVRLYYDADKESVVFEVEDNGVGMAPQVLKRCMEPFYTTKETGEGTGLGLSIVHSLVKEFAMAVEVHSTEGQGSTFRLIIPGEK